MNYIEILRDPSHVHFPTESQLRKFLSDGMIFRIYYHISMLLYNYLLQLV
jgi:hypothetical protein